MVDKSEQSSLLESTAEEKSKGKEDVKKHPNVCPVCMSWISEHEDPFLRHAGWYKCRSCGFSEKRVI